MVSKYLLPLVVALAPLLVSGAPFVYYFARDVTSDATLGSRQCGFGGNQDFYGLGIRLGIYLQWLTSLLAHRYLREAVEDNLDTNTIFLLAVFVALVVATLQKTVRTAEILVLLYLCFGFVFSILSVWGHRATSSVKNPIRFPLVGSFSRLVLTTAISAYAVWFWLTGIRLIDNGEPCPPQAFLFARVDALGSSRIFFRSASILILGIYGILFSLEILMLIFFYLRTAFWSAAVAIIYAVFSVSRGHSILRGIWNGEKHFFRTTSVLFWSWANGKESSGPGRPEFEGWFLFSTNVILFISRSVVQLFCLFAFKKSPPMGFPPLFDPVHLASRVRSETTKLVVVYVKRWVTAMTVFMFNAVSMVFAIIAVELTLHWNGVSGIYSIQSTGQLIPFIIGLFGLLRLLHAISVRGSSLTAINILMALVDLGESPSSIQPDYSVHGFYDSPTVSSTHETTYSLHDGTEAVFDLRKSQRRNSISDMERNASNGTHEKQSRNSLELFRRSVDVNTNALLWSIAGVGPYNVENTDVYRMKNGTEFHIVKDFTKSCDNPRIMMGDPRIFMFGSNEEDHQRATASSMRSTSEASEQDSRPRRPRSSARGSPSRARARTSFVREIANQARPSSIYYSDTSSYYVERRVILPRARHSRSSSSSRRTRSRTSNIHAGIFAVFPKLLLPLLLVMIWLVNLPFVKRRAMFAAKEFSERFAANWQSWVQRVRAKNSSDATHTQPEPIEQGRNTADPIVEAAPYKFEAGSLPGFSLDQGPHRRLKHISELRTAFRRRACYETALELSRFAASMCSRSGTKALADLFNKATSALIEVKEIREEFKKGVIGLEEQREEALKQWHAVFDKGSVKVFAEEVVDAASKFAPATRKAKSSRVDAEPEGYTLRRAWTWTRLESASEPLSASRDTPSSFYVRHGDAEADSIRRSPRGVS